MKPPNHGSDADDMKDVPSASHDAGLLDEGGLAGSVADDSLVHAMLMGRFQDTAQATSRRVEEARRAFEGSPSRLWRHWRAGLSTAAAAVIVGGLLLIFSSPQEVQADLREILEVFDVGDKTYQIEISEDAYQPLRRGRRRTRGRIGRGQPFWVPRPKPAPQHLDGAFLYVRDRQYVLVYNRPAGPKIVKGYDGQQSWLIGPGGRSRTGVDPNVLQRDIPEDIASLLFLDLRDILHQVDENYRLSDPTEWTLQDTQKHVLCYVAERTSRMARLPQRIELWVDAETSQLDHIICTGMGFRSPSGRYTLRIDLISTDPLPADWFTQAAYRAP
ncbi:MAG: hypothetical protein ACYTAS_06605 [Planctomycetota bacterium]|jgi:hypothetical protein